MKTYRQQPKPQASRLPRSAPKPSDTTGRRWPPLSSPLRLAAALAAIVSPLASTEAATLTSPDALGTSSFNTAGNWSDGQAPHSGTTYTVAVNYLRTPADSSSYTFAGDSLTITAGGGMIYKGSGTNTYTIDPLILDNGGLVRSGASSTQRMILDGTIQVTGASASQILADQSPYTIDADLSGSGDLLFSGGYTTTFAGTSTLTGNLSVTGNLVLDATSSLAFTIGTSGTNNSISGSGSATYDGSFSFDLSGAGTAVGNSWTVASVASGSVGSTFTVTGFSRVGGGSGAGVWQLDNGGVYYEFDTSTGVLEVVSSLGGGTLDLNDESYTTGALAGSTVTMTGHSELHLTGAADPIPGTSIDLQSEDSWVFFHDSTVPPSYTISTLLSRITVSGAAATQGSNVRVVEYGNGSVVIPQPSNFQPMEVFDGENFGGVSALLSPNTAYGTVLGGRISSFTLKRGYTATLAANSNGTGLNINYVAADGDLQIGALPSGLNNQVNFIRIYPWHWVSKKGSCDIAPTDVDAKWYYNWNVTSQPENPDFEYVAIKQQRWWPGLPDPTFAAYLGTNHVSGYNEPNNPVEDAYVSLNNGDVATAVAAWGDLEWTGMRIGAPAVTDGGRSWILDFMNQAEAAGRRVDYVPIHYYRASNNDPASAASALYSFLKDIYDNTHKPIWLTEFNNGANWTGGTDPTFQQNADCIEAMINMMDDAPWIERYSVYSAVEEVRQVYYNAGGYTPMGAMYRDHLSPIAYQQIIPGEGMEPSGSYGFENDLNDDSGSGNHAVSRDYPDFVAGHSGGTALQFDGVDDHVILPDSLSDGTDFTFAAWVNWTGSGSSWQRIFDFGILDSGNFMFLTPNASGAGLRFAINLNWGGEQQLNTGALTPNTWTHVAVTLSGNTGRLYVNGSEVAINTTMTNNPSDLDAIQHYLGRSMFGADPHFSGKLDDVIIKDQALGATQIAALAAGNQAPSSASLVDGGSATQGQPYSGSVAGTATDPDAGDTITYSKVYGPSWLAVATDGTLSGTPTTGDEGTQSFTVRATDQAGATTHFVLTIQLPITPPAAPSGLSAVAGDLTVSLDWADNTEPDLAGYNVKRATAAGGPYTTVASSISGSNYTDNSVTNGTTYYYVVTAVDIDAYESSNSNEASATPQAPTPALVAHYEFEGDATDSTGSYDATVNGPPGSPAYVAGQIGQAIDLDAVDDVVTLPAGVADSSDLTVATWVNWDGVGTWSRIFDFGNNTSQYLFLTPNSGSGTLRFAIKNGGSEQIVETAALAVGTWTHLAVRLEGDTATLYVDGTPVAVNASTTINPSEFAPTLNYIGQSQFADPLFDGRIDDFRIYNHALSDTEVAALAGGSDITPPAAPTGLAATAGDNSVGLDWADNSEPDLASYTVYRSTTSGSGYASVASGLATSDYTDNTAVNGTTYYYVVTATDSSSNESANSGEASATPSAPDTTPPAAPTGLAANAGDNSVDLDWADNGEPDLASYTVYRSTTSGSGYASIASGLVVSAYTDNTAANDTTYYYVVTASDTSSNESANSSEVSATPTAPPDLTPPAAPTGLAANAGDNSVDLDWADNGEPDLASYTVYRSTTSGSGYSSIASGLALSAYTDATAVNGTTYYYVVTATDNSSNESSFSGEASATPAPPLPATPGNLLATAVSISRIDLSWTAASGADTYTVKWSANPGGPYAVLQGDHTGTSYSDTDVLAGSTVYYVVSATNPGGESPDSNEASATTPELVADLPFDETTGTTATDLSPNGFDATLVGGANWITGLINNGLDLDGIDGHATLPAGVVSHVGDCTLTAWVHLDTVSNWQRVFDFGTGTSAYLYLTPQTDTGVARFGITTGGAAGEEQIDGTAPLPSGAWTHVAVTLSGGQGLLYVNGSEVGSNNAMTLDPASLGSTTLNYIGRSQFADPYLDGIVDELQIVGRALSPAEIAALALPPGGAVDDYPNADVPVSGTVSGSFADTQGSDNVYESLTEVISGGKPSNRYSLLEHKWAIDVLGGQAVTFFVEAHHSANTEGDDFVFAYSTDDVNYTDMVTVTKTADDDQTQSYALPGTTSGTVYIRVRDTDSTAGAQSFDTVFIDEMFIRSDGDPPPNGAPTFNSDPVVETGAVEGTAYSSTLVDDASDPDSDPLSFSKLSGPAWLNVNSNGSLSGTPGAGDVGLNSWMVQVDDGNGGTDAATLEIDVSPVGSQPDMSVADIAMSFGSYGGNRYSGIATITVLDEFGSPVANATVSVDWSGATTESNSGTTNGSGQVTIESSKVKNGGTYTVTVTDVSASGYTYNAALNAETSDSVAAP